MAHDSNLLFSPSDRDYLNEIADFFDLNLNTAWLDDFSKKLYSWSLSHIPNIQVISIFSGAGGLDIGFRDAGFNILSHLELENDFCETLNLNSDYYKNANVINIDIRDYQPCDKIKCDFIIGGPPCQTFSAAGRRASGVQGIDDNRGTLFEEYIRLLKFYNPRGFLFENVYGITGAQSGKAWELIKDEFSKAGYKIYFRILNTADYGVPQFRERMIIVGVKNGKYNFPRPIYGPDSSTNRDYYSAQQALENVPIDEDLKKLILNGRHGHLLNDIPPGLNYSFYTEKMGHPEPLFAWRSKFSDYLYKADPTKPVRTIKAQGGQYTGPLHWSNRHFSVNEYKRLQSFPDTYKIFGNRQRAIHQIGNSVPPQFARILALSILEQIFSIKLPFKVEYLHDSEVLSFRKRKRQLSSEYLDSAKNANLGKTIKTKTINEDTFLISVTNEFKTIINESADFSIHVEPKPDYLLIELNESKAKSIKYKLVIKPHNTKKWALPCDYVQIISYSSSVWSYVTAWKAFEYIINTNKIMDDLVQLNGYYQYVPKIDFDLEIIDKKLLKDPEWKLIHNLIKNKPIRILYSYEEMSEMLSLDSLDVVDAAKFLKNIGYEIRNHNTNPQIKKNHFLLPYLFPTLTNLSVQLRKCL